MLWREINNPHNIECHLFYWYEKLYLSGMSKAILQSEFDC